MYLTYSTKKILSSNCIFTTTSTTKSDKQGTTVTFTPDFVRFGCTEFDSQIKDVIENRLGLLQVCYPGIKFKFNGSLIKTNNIKKYLKKIKNPNYLDLCCGDGRKTLLVSKMLNFKDNNVNGTDIKIWGPYKKNRTLPFNFKFILENGNLDYPDNYSNQEYFNKN